jgi:excisionase family DNA binding protein
MVNFPNGASGFPIEIQQAFIQLVTVIEELANAARQKERPTKRLYTVQEAARYLGRTPNAVWELIWSGKLPTVRIDRRVQIDIGDLDAVIDRHKTLNK